MTREEYIKICRGCLNRKFDPKQGLICKMSEAKAAFENECSDFKLDESHIVHQETAHQIEEQNKNDAQKDMIYGALWCVGGTIATVADVGFIFWGAILFGAIQFIKGAINSR